MKKLTVISVSLLALAAVFAWQPSKSDNHTTVACGGCTNSISATLACGGCTNTVDFACGGCTNSIGATLAMAGF